ncbi:hypothetical protein ACFWVC_07715 [Streptomyces sp. NPDC058691]|uniref:hypothetical protein n=1 Tax=Streptomyces sp. NPDC058691 TaxID=3346601 RepID=UPI003664322D
MAEPSDFVARLRADQQDPGREEALRRDKSRRRRKAVLLASAGALVLTGFGVWLNSVTGHRPAKEPYAPQLLQEDMWPDEWPATVRLPFRGSPAAAWEDGSHGIVAPRAEATDDYSATEVAAALRHSREFLIESNVTPAPLTGETPSAALDLLDPRDPGTRELQDALEHPGKGHSPLDVFTRFDPEKDVVVEGAMKTRGTMTYEVSSSGELLVHADYTFVYAVTKAHGGWEIVPGAPEASRVIVRRHITLAAGHGGLALREGVRRLVNVDCRAPEDGYIHPLYYKAADKAPKSTSLDPYAAHTGLQDIPDGCITPTRT